MDAREPSPDPDGLGALFGDRDPAQLDDPDAARQRLRQAADQTGRCRSEQHDAAARIGIEKAAQRGEECRQPLGLVNDQPAML